MLLQGRVIFGSKTKSNNVTVEGAMAILDSLTNNDVGFISNILFITDLEKRQELEDRVDSDFHKVTWDILYNGGNPLYDSRYCFGVTTNPDNNKGTIHLVQGQESGNRIILKMNCTMEPGVAPLEGFTALGMAVILNGRGTTFVDGSYVPSDGGGEKVLCYVNSNVAFSYTSDNEFDWELILDVSQ